MLRPRAGQRALSAKPRALGKRASVPTARSANLLSNVRNVQITGGSFSVAGGDVHNHSHTGSVSESAIWSALQAISNFRKIYQDMLGKATPGTGMWLLKNEKFRVWLEANGDIKIFWGSGIPGAGKTILASIVIERLETLRRESGVPICVCYFYFRHSDHTELSIGAILSTFVKQTLERHPDCLLEVQDAYAQHLREGTEPTEAQLLHLLGQFNESMAATFYILDALDEAPTALQLSIVKALSSLNVKLFITSRPLEAVQANFPYAYQQMKAR